MTLATIPDRKRNQYLKINWGGVYVTYTDWKGEGYNFSNTYPPHNYGKFDRFVHKNRKLITQEPPPLTPPVSHRELPLPRFEPEIKKYFYATGFYQTSGTGAYIEGLLTNNSRNKYWINKNNSRCLNWDIDTVYVDGEIHQVIKYPDNPPHSMRHKVVVCCCYGEEKITQNDLDNWGTNAVHGAQAIGRKKIIVIVFLPNIDPATFHDGTFNIRVYSDNAIGLLGSEQPMYERQIPSPDYYKAFNYVHLGFKTDGKTLVFFKSTYSPPTPSEDVAEGGVYKMVFSDHYKTEVITKIGDHHFAVYNEISSIAITPPDHSSNNPTDTIDAVVDGTLVDGGKHVIDVFQDKDNFTVIYKVDSSYLWHEDYTYRSNKDSTGIPTSIVNGEVNNQYDYHVYKIDWKTNTVVDTGKIIISHYDKRTYGSNDSGGIGSKFNNGEKYDLAAKLIYANHAKDLYIYRTNVWAYGQTSSSDGNTITTKEFANYNVKLFKEHKGVKILVDSFDDHTENETNVPGSIADGHWGNYYNGSASYESEPYYYPSAKKYAFDGTLLVCCFDMSDSDTNTISQYRKRFRTLIYNVNTGETQMLDYRVDNDASSNKIYPLTVTSIPKGI